MSEVQFTIAGETFTLSTRYEAGHTLTDGEASALNQTFVENVRNNLAKTVKQAKEAGSFDASAIQEQVTKYADAYQFGVRPIGGGGAGLARDPVEAEARSLAKAAISASLKAKGRTLKSVEPDKLEAAIAALLERDPTFRETAKERVEQKRGIAKGALEDLDLGDAPTVEQAEGEAKPKASRKKTA